MKSNNHAVLATHMSATLFAVQLTYLSNVPILNLCALGEAYHGEMS